MKREEKNQQTQRRIMDGALAEFSAKGYGGSSVNAICSSQEISKGIVYHYFETKDALFLACVEECFMLLTEAIKQRMKEADAWERQELKPNEFSKRKLEEYFQSRMDFFEQFPIYQKIFCEAVITPPEHLRSAIQEKKKSFDILNIQILQHLLSPLKLRSHITAEEVIEMFRRFQDFINADSRNKGSYEGEFEAHEEQCRTIMDILFYGVIDRKEED